MFNFEVHADFKAVAELYAEHLSKEILRADLANALNQGVRAANKYEREFAYNEYNFSKEVLNKEGRFRMKRARADTDNMAAGLFVSSKPVSLMPFVVAAKPIAVFIRSRVDMPHAFLVSTPDKAKMAGVFMRDTARAKYAPTKGSYHGRVVTRGPNKGRPLLRQAIDKKYTLTTAQVADKGSGEAMKRADLVRNYEARLEKRLKALQAAKT